MTDKLKQIAKKEISKLPIEAQNAINAFDWVKETEEIGKKYLLNESETNDFQVETLLVLTGIEDGDYYAQNIENNLGTSKDEAEEMTEEAFQKIFMPINDILVENIKKSPKSKNPDPKQTLYFILSGGDYSAFIDGKENTDTKTQETVLPAFSIKK